MPTTYAHDCFGREVYMRLPADLKEIIRKNKKLFLIGLHGPDIFFYYHPLKKNRISELGSDLHNQKASLFFSNGVRLYQEHPSGALESYLFGFACHFMLDSTCHPYIGQYTEQMEVSHAKIETHLDRCLMIRDGKNPLTFHPAASICPHTEGNRIIHQCFPMVSCQEIEECLKGMRLYTRVTVFRCPLPREILRLGMRLVGCYNSMEGRIMPAKPDPKCRIGIRNLIALYQKALCETPEELIRLDRALHGTESLSPRFERNFE
ncbi:MAG: zinc dependent phospholipase C family protein [Fusicatenibacter sp.]|nr:zinc dependent phospholipase C family protein [Fusicatenibacter sp.]